MKLTILVPVYNEKNTVLAVVNKLNNLEIDKEIIIIDDGSTDGTREILSSIKHPASSIKIAFHEKNQGKGRAIQTGLKYATGDVVCIQDADMEYNPEQIPDLMLPFNDNNIDAVFGSRFLKPNPNLYKRYLLGNKFLTWLINLLYGSKYTDTYTGYKFIRRDIFNKLNLQSSSFEVEAEISIKLKKIGARTIELPISYFPRSLEEGKKIKFKDALKGLWTIICLLWD